MSAILDHAYVSCVWTLFLTWYPTVLQVFGAFALFHVLTYFIPHWWVSLRWEQNLKKKYNASWALVTGSSSGIGAALAERLLNQGLNIVMVALDDDLLHKTHAKFVKEFPEREIRAVGVNLNDSLGGYMADIEEATRDIPVQCVFNNAGYIITGVFRKLPIETHIGNLQCNAVAGLRITHHFTNRMVEEGLRGCIVFTSSPAAYVPNPMATLYGSTKAFVTEFGASFATEAAAHGIDVTVIHPPPVHSRFLEGKTKLDAFDFAYKFGWFPDQVSKEFLRSVGRMCITREVGFFAVFTRFLPKILDFNFFAWIMLIASPMTGDYKKHILGDGDNAGKKKNSATRGRTTAKAAKAKVSRSRSRSKSARRR